MTMRSRSGSPSCLKENLFSLFSSLNVNVSIPMKVEVEIEEEAALGGQDWSGSSRNERDNDEGQLVVEDSDEDTLASEDISVRPLFRGFEHLTKIQCILYFFEILIRFLFPCLCHILCVCFENSSTVKFALSSIWTSG